MPILPAKAYCEFAEDRKGRIRAGYLADMVILDKDIFEIPVDEIKNVRPVRTNCGGKTVYRSDYSEASRYSLFGRLKKADYNF